MKARRLHEARGEFGRGWGALLATTVGNGAGLAALPFYALSSFMAPLHAQFGWGRAQIGLAATVLAAGTFCTAAPFGALCDRFGALRVALVSVPLFAFCFVLLACLGPGIWGLYGVYAAMALVGGATTSIAYARIVAARFARHRGMALGIMTTGGGVTALGLPLLLHGVIAAEGWRAAWLACLAIALAPLPLLLWLVRDEGSVTAAPDAAAEGGQSLREAVRTRDFWQLGAGAFLFIGAAGGLVAHLQPVLQDAGKSAAEAAGVAGLLGAGIMVGRLGTGFLLDRVPARGLAALEMLAACCGFALLAARLPGLAWLGVCLVGLTLGAEGDLLAFMAARRFGLRHYAAIFGWLFGMMSLGSATGPLVMGWFSRAQGGYGAALAVFAGQCVLAAVLFGGLSARVAHVR